MDLRELGSMFRLLGQSPSEQDMRDMIDAVDFDGSGTVDFEEWCLLMLRQKRAANTPEWLTALFTPADGGADGADDAATPTAAKPQSEHLVLRGDASKHGGNSNSTSLAGRFVGGGEAAAAPEAAAADKAGGGGEPLSREMLLVVSDLLPFATHVVSLVLSGHGPLMGPFVAAEIARALHKNNRSITHLDLSSDNIGDDGAEALALCLEANPSIRSLYINLNAIGGRGGTALLKSLRTGPPAADAASGGKKGAKDLASRRMNAGLRELELEGNLISPDMHAAIQQQLLLNNLPRLFAESLVGGLDAPAATPGKLAKGKSRKSNAADAPPGGSTETMRKAAMQIVHSSLAGGKPPAAATPSASLSEQWLTEGHAAALLVEVMATSAASLTLTHSGRFGGNGLAGLLAPMGPPSPLASMVELRIAHCSVDDLACAPLAAALSGDGLPLLRTLALDHNQLTLGVPTISADYGADLADGELDGGGPEIGAVLLARAINKNATITDLDLSANPIQDGHAAALVSTLLDGPGGATLRCLHLGGTSSGDATAAACASAMLTHGPSTLALTTLCLSGGVGDAGAMELASALPYASALRELWLGDKITDAGAEALAASIMAAPSDGTGPVLLERLCLGGESRSGVVLKNELGPKAAVLFGALPHSSCSLTDLRLSGNAGLGSTGCIRLVGALQATASKKGSEQCKLRTLHLDGCGLLKDDVNAFLAALDTVWCLHELRVDADVETRTPAKSEGPAGVAATPAKVFGKQPTSKQGEPLATPLGGGGSPEMNTGGSKWSVGSKGGAVRLFTLQQKLGMAKLLEDNKSMGHRRVEQWRLNGALAEVGWVFTSLCQNGTDNRLPPESVEAGLDGWDGRACGQFVKNLGLPQYQESFEFNLRGSMLESLRMGQLAQLGVGVFAHQKAIMEGTRQLVDAYSRKARAQKADELWTNMFKGLGAAAADEDDVLDVTDAPTPPVGGRTPGTADRPTDRRRGGLQPGKVVLSQSGGGPNPGGGPRIDVDAAGLPINLHLPRIAKLHGKGGGGVYGRRFHPRPETVPKPSIVPPRGAPPGEVAARAAAAAAADPLGVRPPASALGMAAPTEWKQLARSYGLHLLPESGKLLLDDPSLAVVLNAPQPPELRYGLAASVSAGAPREGSRKSLPSLLDANGPDLGSSPSLPMLSPGRPGARNWVTFLHG